MKTATNGMGKWKARQLVKGARRSVTTGKSKGIVSTAMERTICRRNRSWKMREYAPTMARMSGEKRRKKA